MNESFTPEENFRMFGNVPKTQLEDLLDDSSRAEAIKEALPCLDEAKSCLPDEDFMQRHINSLKNIAKQMRASSNKTELLEVIEKLECLQTETYNETAYAIEQIDMVANAI